MLKHILVLTLISSPAFADMPCWVEGGAAQGDAVWLLCDRAEILRSIDAGVTWKRVPLPLEGKMNGIAFIDAKRGFVVGDDGALLATTDGGQTWAKRAAGTDRHLNDIYFLGQEGWIGGGGGTVLHTSDAGATWTAQTTGVTLAINNIFFLDAQHGWAVGWVGLILRTSNGGAKWEEIKNSTAGWSLNLVRFKDLRNGWIVGPFGQILRSTDGGATWTQLESPVTTWLSSIYFDPSGKAWIAGERDLLLSEDGGQTWRRLGIQNWLFLEEFITVRGVVWAVGPFGVLKQNPSDRVKWEMVSDIKATS